MHVYTRIYLEARKAAHQPLRLIFIIPEHMGSPHKNEQCLDFFALIILDSCSEREAKIKESDHCVIVQN